MQQTSYAFSGDFGSADRNLAGRRSIYLSFGKRFADITAVLLASPFLLPLTLITWLAVRLSGSPGIYGQERIGRGGRVFKCWKIRTMVPDAETLLEDYLANNPELAREWHESQKLRNDPRITRLGRFLRRTSLDELPQFWNVLVGDMSLIGPRPFTPAQKPLYDSDPRAASYYRLRPGLSGMWQVASRNRTTFRARVGFDHAYLSQVSFRLDLKLMFRTISVVIRATGS